MTWINEKMSAKKYVNTPGHWVRYLKSSDSRSHNEFSVEIVSKWTDSEGNTWYKTFMLEFFMPDAGHPETMKMRLVVGRMRSRKLASEGR
jgi:hypothetical protein